MPAFMAKSHIDGFLAAVRRVNPGFKEAAEGFGRRNSSLHGLLAYLRNTSANPVPFANRQAALLRCADPNDRRLAKYHPAIDRLVAVWASGTPFEIQEVEVGRLMFRGDTRAPAEIFPNGFAPREQGAIRYRDAQQDIDPATAVAVSPNPRAAANFPLPDAFGPGAFGRASGNSWVYAVYLEHGYNTNGQQGLNFAAGSAGAGRLLYAGEMASSGIPAAHVVGAIQVWRNFIHVPGIAKPADWFARGMFRFVEGSWQANPGYQGPAAYVALAANVFRYGLQGFLVPTAPLRGPADG